MRTFLTGAAVAALLWSSDALAQNLIQNPDFQVATTAPGVTLSGGGYPTTDVTGVSATNLSGLAAAENWLTWTGGVGGRIRTRLEPSELYGPSRRMLHVVVNSVTPFGGVDEMFMPRGRGVKRADYCVLLKIVSGSVQVGSSAEGNSGNGARIVTEQGRWIAVRGSAAPPLLINQLMVFAYTPDAEYYVQNAVETTDPIAPKDCVAPEQTAVTFHPQTLVKPDPYPWTLHPDQGAVQPTQGGTDQPSPLGHFDNMRPPVAGGQPSPTETEDHERGHDHGGGKDDKGGGKGQPVQNTLPSSANQIQPQQQPAGQ